MTKKSKSKTKITSDKSFGFSLGHLLKEQGLVSDSQKMTSQNNQITQENEITYDLTSCSKLVIRHETKRRKGKTVTLIKGFSFSQTQLKKLAQDMRKALGCGSGIENDGIVLQGEQIQRVHTWLQNHGAKKIILATRPK